MPDIPDLAGSCKKQAVIGVGFRVNFEKYMQQQEEEQQQQLELKQNSETARARTTSSAALSPQTTYLHRLSCDDTGGDDLADNDASDFDDRDDGDGDADEGGNDDDDSDDDDDRDHDSESLNLHGNDHTDFFPPVRMGSELCGVVWARQVVS